MTRHLKLSAAFGLHTQPACAQDQIVPDPQNAQAPMAQENTKTMQGD